MVSATSLAAPEAARATGAGRRALLDGPDAAEGAESLGEHLARLGPMPGVSRDAILEAVHASGLKGRGGGRFPLWRKLRVASEAAGQPVLLVNCSESEPASRKDAVLCMLRPHLVLDGAAAMARAIGATEVTVHLHAGAPSLDPLRGALRERAVEGDPVWGVSVGPGGYVSGEASAVARFLHEGVALPLSNAQPMARCGPSGRPTVVSNAETAAHVGLLLRMGAEGWRRCGTDDSPGPHLATLAGAVREPGAVAEVLGAVTIGEILQGHGVSAPPLAVLLGGYAGTWLPGSVAWTAPWDDAALARLGAGQGCGLIGVLPHGACGLVETARLSAYLAGESAGQCGPCVHGLPVVAEAMQTLASGSHGRRRALGRLHRTMRALPGSGACRHPDGVVRMVQSALRTFESDAVRHGRGKPCSGAGHPPVFPLPARGHGGR